jgi:hypothetical protein
MFDIQIFKSIFQRERKIKKFFGIREINDWNFKKKLNSNPQNQTINIFNNQIGISN